jgi:hypothetical protein
MENNNIKEVHNIIILVGAEESRERGRGWRMNRRYEVRVRDFKEGGGESRFWRLENSLSTLISTDVIGDLNSKEVMRQMGIY